MEVEDGETVVENMVRNVEQDVENSKNLRRGWLELGMSFGDENEMQDFYTN